MYQLEQIKQPKKHFEGIGIKNLQENSDSDYSQRQSAKLNEIDQNEDDVPDFVNEIDSGHLMRRATEKHGDKSPATKANQSMLAPNSH